MVTRLPETEAERAEALATARRAEYRAYLCMMTSHGCACVALGFDEWSALPAEQVRS